MVNPEERPSLWERENKHVAFLFPLQLIHGTVVDTAIVFPHRLGLPYKRALRTLMADYLKRIIQDNGETEAELRVRVCHPVPPGCSSLDLPPSLLSPGPVLLLLNFPLRSACQSL